MYVTTEITIDFLRPRKNIMEVVQDDTTRKIRLILKSGGNDFNVSADLASGDSVVGAVAYLKSDGHGGVYDTTPDGDTAVQLVSGTVNQFDVLLVGQVFTAAGWTQVNIKFYNSDFSKVLSTFAINVHVQRNAASDYESEDYSNMESLGAIRAELLALKADTEQDVTDEYAAAAQETPGLTYEQFFMSLPNGRYRVVERDYIHKAEVVTVDEGQYCKVDVFDHDGYCETTIYTNGTAVFNYVDGPTTGRIITMPVQVPTPVNPTDAANKQYVDIKGGLSSAAKQALLNCFAHVAWTDEHGQDYYDELEAALMARTLESIAAVFVQGDNVIYDTDSLDDLKSMLTVTAYYDDGTSATVTAYTLSGTLTEGTSTITVGYGGKTATFTVTVTATLFNLENRVINTNEQIVTNLNLLQNDFPFTILFDFTNTANPTSGNVQGVVVKYLFEYNSDHRYRGIAIGKATGSSTILSSWWNSDTKLDLTGTSPAPNRHRIALTHEANSNDLNIKYKAGDGQLLTFTHTNPFTATEIGTFALGGSENHNLPTGTLHLARIYGAVLSDDRIANFFA